jgi:hypothetical protein
MSMHFKFAANSVKNLNCISSGKELPGGIVRRGLKKRLKNSSVKGLTQIKIQAIWLLYHGKFASSFQ